MKLVRPFTLPRERTSPEITRAFQSVQVSLANLEKAINAIPDTAGEFAKLRAALEKLQRETSQQQPMDRRVRVVQTTGGTPIPPPDPEIIFSSRIR